MDITSPFVLKLKGALFAFLGLLAGIVLLAPVFSWQALGLFLISVWAFCRAYYFCFYVLHHYVDPSFRYAGMLDLMKKLLRIKKRAE
ncbi:hypothetical protein KBB96_17710 [Luteolibacter ambystomatis]|uniref:Uncharacterized protein n=1 Tax=Luteolibacter ambystomatis TaxID=2824561 RepID=A0A975IZ94_9BACT|nr:hypothetical protein [Luteolibacter ambystomatis]QUE50683.1 hypothetical protein KBB96_17710 [Luteolibacter ambystomatis]